MVQEADSEMGRRSRLHQLRRGSGGEAHNLQIVCRFVNSWKGDSDNEEFKRLLALVQGEGGTPPHGAGRTSPSEADISLMAKPLRSSTRLADPA